MKDTGISLRVSQQQKKKIRRMALKRGFESISAFLFWLIHKAQIGKIILVLSLGLWLSGCATISYLPFSPQTFAPTTSVEIFWEKPPQKPYIEIGRIIVEGSDKEEVLFKKFKQKAMKVGADAVVVGLEKPDKGIWGTGSASYFYIFSSTTRRIEGLAIKWNEGKINPTSQPKP